MSAENERTGHESARPSLDTRAVRRANDRAVLVGGPLRVLGGEIAGRMAARLDFVRLTPRTILDAGCGLAAAMLVGEFMVSLPLDR